MVLESVVATLLNKYLGKYIDNLDSSKLKIGIRGGDLVLTDLLLKQSALDGLHLPVKTISGCLGKLTLSIPWTVLYSAPVKASIENLYLLVVPNKDIKYDSVSEEKWKQEAKQYKIKQIEEENKQNVETDEPKKDYTFMEKLATQMVRNLQINIKTIHIRYEDRMKNNENQFALGLTLGSLSVSTTDENWEQNISQEMTSMIYKVLSIDGLSVYLNSKIHESFVNLTQVELLTAFREGVASNEVGLHVEGYQYMLGPITAQTKLRLNTKPESDNPPFSIPKVLLSLELDKLQVSISKNQYQDLLVLLKSMEKMTQVSPYRKYRPIVPTYKGHCDVWWKFAYQCILEEKVKRKRRNFDWLHISAHRQLCKEYAQLYEKVLTSKPSMETINACQRYEEALDVLNIVVTRKKVKVELERKELEQENQKRKGSWLKWWGDRSSKTSGTSEADSSKPDIIKQFQDAMTPAENEQLYEAIGYRENAAPAQYPVEFVAMNLNFYLESLEVEVRNEMNQVLLSSLTCVKAKFEQRPVSQAFKVTVTVEEFDVTGMARNSYVPHLVQSEMHREEGTSASSRGDGPLLDIEVDVSPLDSTYDQKVYIISHPLQLVYDTLTIDSVIDVFRVKEENTVISQKLQNAATLKLAEIQEMSALGLHYAIQKHIQLDLKVDLMGFYGIIPHGGFYTGKDQALVVVNLGRVIINSVPRTLDKPLVQKIYKKFSKDEKFKKEMLLRSYDQFEVELRDIQVQMILPGEKWRIQHSNTSEQCLLQPTNLKMNLAKCLFFDDPRLPKFKIYGKLPFINLKIAEERLINLILLFMSISVPEAKGGETGLKLKKRTSQQSLKTLDLGRRSKSLSWLSEVKNSAISPQPNEKVVQFIEAEIKFEMIKLSVALFCKTRENDEKPLADFTMLALEADVTQRTYELSLSLRLGGLSLNKIFEENCINLLSTPMAQGSIQYLLIVNFCKVSQGSPEFQTRHGCVQQLLEFNLSTLNVFVHQEALLDAIQWTNNLQQQVLGKNVKRNVEKNEFSKKIVKDHLGVQSIASIKTLESVNEEGKIRKVKKLVPQKLVNTIDLKVKAKIGEISITLCNMQQSVGALYIKGGEAGVIMKQSCTQMDTRLKNVELTDLRQNTKYPKMLSIIGVEDALSSKVVMFNTGIHHEPDNINMSVTANITRFRVVFLNYFLMALLDFVSHFTTAKAALIEMSAAAAEVAKTNVQLAYEQSYRVQLNIQLKAPIILVPANSMSYDAVLVDFGVITVRNTFQELNVIHENRQLAAVMDHLNLDLENLKLSRVKLRADMEVDIESLLVEPISFKLMVKRNLSADWFTVCPNFDISGCLKSIHVNVSNNDYAVIMALLSENLREPFEVTTPHIAKNVLNTEASTRHSSPTDPVVASLHQQHFPPVDVTTIYTKAAKKSKVKHSIVSIEKEAAKTSTRTVVNLLLTLESLVIDLCERSSETDIKRETSLHSVHKRNGLARFTLYMLSLKSSLLTDGSLSLSLSILNWLMDDTRASQIGTLCRYMERKFVPEDKDQQCSMIDVTFHKKSEIISVDIRVYSFTLILNMEHIGKITDFFSIPDETDDSNYKTGEKNTNISESITAKYIPVENAPSTQFVPNYLPSTESISTESVTTSLSKTEESFKSFILNISVEQPDIILVEEMDINTNAIIMNTEINLKYRHRLDEDTINVALKDLQFFSCCFDPEKRKETKAHILKPVTISLNGSSSTNKVSHLEFTTTNIYMSISPGTIELLMRVMTTITAGQTDTGSVKEEDVEYSNVWKVQTFVEDDYWFLKSEVEEEATQYMKSTMWLKEEQEMLKVYDTCILRIPLLVITVESGEGVNTLPMLLLESDMLAHMSTCNSGLTLDSTLTLQMSYYNSQLAVWEPLIEPIETKRPGGVVVFVPWELKMQVEQHYISDGDLNGDGVKDHVSYIKPKLVFSVSSKETMEMTLTKTSMEVLGNISTAFNNAIYKPEKRLYNASAPYVLKNDLGVDIALLLEDSKFKVCGSKGGQDEIKEIVVKAGAKVDLFLIEDEDIRVFVGHTTQVKERYIHIKMVELGCELALPVVRVDKRYFSLDHDFEGSDTWGLVSDVQVHQEVILVTLRSILQVFNHFESPVTVYYLANKDDEVILVDTIGHKNRLNLPFEAIYNKAGALFFSVNGYSVSSSPFIWRDLHKSLTMTTTLECKSINAKNKELFFIQVVGELEQVYFELTTRHTMASTCYNIHLRPTVILKNYLPQEVVVYTQGIHGDILKSGEMKQIPHVEPGNFSIVIRIRGYLDNEWTCKHDIQANPPEFDVWSFLACEGNQYSRMTMNLGMHCINDNGSLKFSLYCPFWMLNKTGLLLSYMKSSKPGLNTNMLASNKVTNDTANVIYHPPFLKGPILFSFQAKSFFGKKKSRIRVKRGEWSVKFSLDVAGSSGVVTCKADNMVYQIGVNIQLTYNSLTKQVTFTPYHMLVNRFPVAVEVLEVGVPNDHWLKVDPNEVCPFWPTNTPAEMMLRLVGYEGTTIPFPYNSTITCLLKLNNNFGAVNVEVQMTEGGVYITFNPYFPGMAPALVINHTSHKLSLAEKGIEDSYLVLEPNQKVLFNWSTIDGKREFIWCEENSDELIRDGIGEFIINKDKLFWVSFLYGMQRVLLFTPKSSIAHDARVAGELEVFDIEITFSIFGIGLSLVDNVACQEVLYIGLTGPGTVWEQCKVGARKYESVSEENNLIIEAAYTKYQQDLQVGKGLNSKILIKDKLVVDFELSKVLQPHYRDLRRSSNQGLWLQASMSRHHLQVHFKINRLQIDNQAYDCVFPVVLAPVPPPKSVKSEFTIKPFMEVLVVQTFTEYSLVRQFKYFKVLIQEFHVKVDTGFINAVGKMFEASAATDDIEAEQFKEDCELIDEPLIAHFTLQSSQEQKHYFDILHFSPLKIHVSFSMSGGGPQNQAQSVPPVLNILMQSLGVTLTDMQDVILKLAYFERNYTFLNQNQLCDEVAMHYKGQMIKQLYVLVLGLDVLGNPFGLVVGLKQGVQDFFYEPFHGAIQGREEFAQGLVLGARSLFGHTVGGAAGAVSRITGAMGKGIAALTFDDDYQRKRRDIRSTRPRTVQQGIAQSSKGLVMGVVEGVSGVLTKPISGAKQEGVEGFFKGVGKGMVGLITRPTAGVIDFASDSLSVVRQATGLGEEVTRHRQPRFFHSDNLVQPYSKLEAEGKKLLLELEKGKYDATDVYIYHTTIDSGVLLLTDKRMMILKQSDLFGSNQIELSYTWEELLEPPIVSPTGLHFTIQEMKKSALQQSNAFRTINIEDEDLKNNIHDKITTIMSSKTRSVHYTRTRTVPE